MRVIPPIEITEDMVLTSTISELDSSVDPDEWNALTAYAVGDRASRASTHRVYTRLVAGTTATAPEDDPTNWVESAATNKMAMFDYTRNQATIGASPMTVQVATGQRQNAIAFNGVVADSVRVKVYRGNVSPPLEVYDSGLISMIGRSGVVGWYSWFMTSFTNRPRHALFDLPPFTDAIVQFQFLRADGDVSVAAAGMGMQEYIGSIAEGPGDDAISYSSVTRGIGGETELNKRRAIPAQQLSVFNDKIATINRIRDTREYLDAQVAFYVGVEDEDHPYYETFFRQAVWTRWRIQEFSNHFVSQLETEDI